MAFISKDRVTIERDEDKDTIACLDGKPIGQVSEIDNPNAYVEVLENALSAAVVCPVDGGWKIFSTHADYEHWNNQV